jgi:hypothetical protein
LAQPEEAWATGDCRQLLAEQQRSRHDREKIVSAPMMADRLISGLSGGTSSLRGGRALRNLRSGGQAQVKSCAAPRGTDGP